jgi:hypothetical protein
MKIQLFHSDRLRLVSMISVNVGVAQPELQVQLRKTVSDIARVIIGSNSISREKNTDRLNPQFR